MKRLGSSESSDSLGALISICPSTDEKSLSGGSNNINNSNSIYSRGFQSMLEGLDEEECSLEEGSNYQNIITSEKKRRLSIDQVKALEKNFEVENKLEPERKVRLAQELGLQQRQVAVWFQNRRARWKTKQLERDYGILKSSFDSLKQDFEALQSDKEALLKELRDLKSNIQEEETEKINLKSKISMTETTTTTNQENGIGVISISMDFKDGSSDSDSSGILNEENNININNSPISSSVDVLHKEHQLASSPSSIDCFHFSADSRTISTTNTQKSYQQQQFVRMEEHNFFGAEEVPCNFFSDDQAPTLQWYCQDPWN